MLLLRYLMQVPFRTFRSFCLRSVFGMSIGNNSVIYIGTEIREPSLITIGTGTIIGHNCVLDGRGELVIGNNVNFSSEVMIWTMQHNPQSPIFSAHKERVVIEDYVWISCRAIILPGVTVSQGAVVAAGAVVTKSVAPFKIVGGVPAKVIGARNKNLEYSLGANTYWFV